MTFFKTALVAASSILFIPALAVPEIPNPTDAFDAAKNLLQGWTPKPTAGPHLDLRYNMPILGRQQSSLAPIVGYFAPDATCGYLGGEIGAYTRCEGTSTCAAVSDPGALGCCGNGECYFLTTCVDSTFYQTSCDATCRANSNIGRCTQSSLPYCQKYTLVDLDVSGYNCDSTSQNGSVYTLFTTFDGQSNGEWSTLRDTLSDSSEIQQLTDSATGSISAPGPGPVSTASTGNSNNNSNNTNNDGGSSTPVGAIVGGVVGGLAVIALIILGIWLILRRKKKNSTTTPPPAQNYDNNNNGANYTSNPPPPMSPAPAAAAPYYDPKPPVQYQTQPEQYNGAYATQQQTTYQPPVSPQAPSPNNAQQTYYPPPQHNPQVNHPGIPEAPSAAPPVAVELGGDSVIR